MKKKVFFIQALYVKVSPLTAEIDDSLCTKKLFMNKS